MAARFPRLSLSGMPQGLEKIRHPAARKNFFLAVMLPLVLEANQTIAGKRDRLARVGPHLAGGRMIGQDEDPPCAVAGGPEPLDGLVTEGEGSSKKAAQQQAAERDLDRMRS